MKEVERMQLTIFDIYPGSRHINIQKNVNGIKIGSLSLNCW